MNILVVSLYPLERNTSVANSSISIIKGLLALEHHVTVLMPVWHSNDTGCDLSQLRVIRIPGQPDQPYHAKSKWIGKLHSHLDVLDISRGYLKSIRDVVVPDEYFEKLRTINQVNPDLSGYITGEALNGLFTKVSEKEYDIRHNASARVSDVLQSVFGRLDNK